MVEKSKLISLSGQGSLFGNDTPKVYNNLLADYLYDNNSSQIMNNFLVYNEFKNVVSSTASVESLNSTLRRYISNLDDFMVFVTSHRKGFDSDNSNYNLLLHYNDSGTIHRFSINFNEIAKIGLNIGVQWNFDKNYLLVYDAGKVEGVDSTNNVVHEYPLIGDDSKPTNAYTFLIKSLLKDPNSDLPNSGMIFPLISMDSSISDYKFDGYALFTSNSDLCLNLGVETSDDIKSKVMYDIVPQVSSLISSHISGLDALTALKTKTSLYREFESIRRNVLDDEELWLIMLDGDHFKRVNDVYGHEAGDEVIRVIGSSISNSIRPDDQKNLYLIRKSQSLNNISAYRYGGEEFVLFVKGTRDLAVNIARRIKEKIESVIFNFNGKRHVQSVSIGIASVEVDNNLTIEKAIKTVDETLYKAKENRGSIVLRKNSRDYITIADGHENV